KMMGGAKRGPLAGLAHAMGMGTGMPSPEQLAEMAKNMPGGQLPPGMPGLPPNMPGLPGLGGKLPGLPGGRPPGLAKKKKSTINGVRKNSRRPLVIRLAPAATKKSPSNPSSSPANPPPPNARSTNH